MLRDTFQPKTSALKNLQEMFDEYPVVTNESYKLKMEAVGNIPLEDQESQDQEGKLNARQQIFSRL